MSNIPLYTEFDPTKNPSQTLFIEDVVNRIIPLAEEEGIQYVILSGARGSGKSVGVEYLVNYLAINYPGIDMKMSRISIEEIKGGMFKELKEMTPKEILKIDNKESIVYMNDSMVSCFGYGDGNVRRIRGKGNCHSWIMEECTEDEGKAGYSGLNKKALEEISMVARNPGHPNIIFILCNPLGPEYWLYEDYISKARFVDGKRNKSTNEEILENVHVFYSVTSDNTFLRPSYIKNLQRALSPKQALRDIYGQWVNISGGTIYEFDEEIHYKDEEYIINDNFSEIISWDFNTAEKKPMSVVMGQFINDHLHMYDECILYNSNTKQMLLELEAKGFFKKFSKESGKELIIMGDSAGWSRQSGGQASGAEVSDYSIIRDFLDHLTYYVNYDIQVPRKHPGVRERHNLVNGYLKNMHGEVRITFYKGCKMLVKGMKTTKLKKGAGYTEDDSNPAQHSTTCLGYLLWRATREEGGIEYIPR